MNTAPPVVSSDRDGFIERAAWMHNRLARSIATGLIFRTRLYLESGKYRTGDVVRPTYFDVLRRRRDRREVIRYLVKERIDALRPGDSSGATDSYVLQWQGGADFIITPVPAR